jgi:3-hydroxyisobutyrate dehydrogenase
MAHIAFVGLGVMGWPMARHLVSAGHELRLFNRTAEKAVRFAAAHGGKPAATLAEAADGAEALITCVGNDADVQQVTEGRGGAFGTLPDGALFIDHSTASAALARALAERHPRLRCIDAPVSGGEAGAINGKLTIMCGGEEDAFAKAEPVMAAFARAATLIGPSGAGQLAKSVNQICIAGIVQGLSEALHFADKAGLDAEKVIAAISGGAAQSWQMENRWKTMTEGKFDFGFAVDWMRKDLRITLDAARENGASLPLTAQVDQYYADVQAMGGNRWDTSSLIARLNRKPG